jgi:hypothetical protein
VISSALRPLGQSETDVVRTRSTVVAGVARSSTVRQKALMSGTGGGDEADVVDTVTAGLSTATPARV